jgi:hypothetical protein
LGLGEAEAAGLGEAEIRCAVAPPRLLPVTADVSATVPPTIATAPAAPAASRVQEGSAKRLKRMATTFREALQKPLPRPVNVL